jgi:hypothetical protein
MSTDETTKKEKTRYDINLLTSFCTENNIELLKDYSKENINCKKRIEGKCMNKECENKFNKQFCKLLKSGPYCIVCTTLNGITKYKKNCMEKYGVENTFKLQNIQEKMKNTMIERYGVEYTGCSKELMEKMKNTMIERYGVDHPTKSQEIIENKKKTCLEKYGVEYHIQSEQVKEKSKNTCMINHGVEYYLQSEEVKEKSKKTMIERYGVENPLQLQEVKEKIKKTCMEIYGVEWVLQSQEIKEKIKLTNIKKYGFENPSHNAEISEKASKKAYKAKDYIFPSGRIERIQGYEPFMLNELLQKENVSEDDIIVNRKEVPEIWYEDANGKKHRYFVDCYITSQQRCIEAKSTWTAKKKKDCIFLKQQAVKDAGYECEIWIYNEKGEKVEMYM